MKVFVNDTVGAMYNLLGEYAPRRRSLLADYKDSSGRDLHQSLTTIHSPGLTDTDLVEFIQKELARVGCKLSSLVEQVEDGRWKHLYLAPGIFEESMQELGILVPKDVPAALRAAGIRPVNWEELGL